MGILNNIFKKLGWGGEDEQAESAKRIEATSTTRPVESQSYTGRSSTGAPSLPETSPAARVERPLEVGVRAPQTAPQTQSAPVPTSVKPPEPVHTHQPEIPPPPAFKSQPGETYRPPQAVEEEYDNIPMEPFESNIEEASFQPPQELRPNPAISMEDMAEAIQSSTPPPIPGSPAVEANFFKEVIDDFDEAFDAAFRTDVVLAPETASAGTVQHDQSAIQDLFANIAANYARPVKNFIFELKRGTATKEWIEICRPALRSISRAAESMDLELATKRMVDFDEALSLAQISEDRVLGGEIRDLILSSYEELVEILPQTFVIGQEEQQREGIIINSLLKQIPDLGRVTFEKLYGAGLTSLDTLFLAKKEDLAAATGIPLWLCERICNKFQQYREELEGTPRDVAQSGYRSRLGELVVELRRQHEGFERASAEEWSNPALATEKRRFRQNRQACVLQINVVLAEMGELDLVNEIQKLSFERRIQRLEEYLMNPTGMM
ncbi:MAG: hypothetical protein AB1489_01435 [Acidobacteriota bacterium]